MAKSKKAASAKASPKKRAKAKSIPGKAPVSRSVPAAAPAGNLSTEALVAVKSAVSQNVSIDFTFTGGIGQATAILFRNGVLINMQSISETGSIVFSDVQSGDVVTINGVCTGTATVKLSTPTIPANPKNFPTGLMMANFLIK